nr:type II toxin-antitoxin system PrlF family antitoxin [uncultured Ottowia sp.]
MSHNKSSQVSELQQHKIPDEEYVVEQFLDFLSRDIAAHPERLQPLTWDLVRRGQGLAAGIEVDLDEALPIESGESFEGGTTLPTDFNDPPLSA